MRSYLNQKHDIKTEEQMLTAMSSDGPRLRGLCFVLAEVQGGVNSRTKIENIGDMSHFTYTNESLTIWKFLDIGTGRKMPVSAFEEIGGKLLISKVSGRVILPDVDPYLVYSDLWIFAEKKNSVTEPNDSEGEAVNGEEEPSSPPMPRDATQEDSQDSLLVCRKCGAQFILRKNLDRHMLIDKHWKRPQAVTMMDEALGYYSNRIEGVRRGIDVVPLPDAVKSLSISPNLTLKRGWALRVKKTSKRLPEGTRKFLVELYEEAAGRKSSISPYDAEKRMQANKDIETDDFMSLDQIRNLFTSLTAAKKANKGKVTKTTKSHRAARHIEIDTEVFVLDIILESSRPGKLTKQYLSCLQEDWVTGEEATTNDDEEWSDMAFHMDDAELDHSKTFDYFSEPEIIDQLFNPDPLQNEIGRNM